MPAALLEAMSAGRAVVAFDIPGVNEVVTDKETGILVHPASPEDLATKLSALLGDVTAAQRLGVAARQYVQTYHNWDTIIDRMEQLYGSVKHHDTVALH